jgi:hypothetical protein
LLKLLPEGWEAKAKELKAFQRAWGITSPKDLLKTILLYLTKGKSFRGISAIKRLSGEGTISDVALLKRIRNSAALLQWLCGDFSFGTASINYSLNLLSLISSFPAVRSAPFHSP